MSSDAARFYNDEKLYGEKLKRLKLVEIKIKTVFYTDLLNSLYYGGEHEEDKK